MINFFKNFGKGILYVLVLPFLLVGMAIYGVIALFVFLFLCIKGLILFFTGRSLYEDLPEDIEAKKRLAAFANPNPQPQSVNNSGTTIINATPIIDNGEQSSDPFYVPEYLKDEGAIEEEKEEPVLDEIETPKEEVVIEEPVQEEKKLNEPVDDVITIEKSPQNTTIYEISGDDEDDDDTGVNIDFD